LLLFAWYAAKHFLQLTADQFFFGFSRLLFQPVMPKESFQTRDSHLPPLRSASAQSSAGFNVGSASLVRRSGLLKTSRSARDAQDLGFGSGFFGVPGERLDKSVPHFRQTFIEFGFSILHVGHLTAFSVLDGLKHIGSPFRHCFIWIKAMAWCCRCFIHPMTRQKDFPYFQNHIGQ